jgi:hypothetical protein
MMMKIMMVIIVIVIIIIIMGHECISGTLGWSIGTGIEKGKDPRT